jgi:hypothetical protein
MAAETSQNKRNKPGEIVQAQLDAYNRRDIDAFLAVYDDDIELILLASNEVFCRGKSCMRDLYEKLFDNHPNLHCKLHARIVCGRFVIDREEVTIDGAKPPVHAAAIYETRDGLINRAWFIKG